MTCAPGRVSILFALLAITVLSVRAKGDDAADGRIDFARDVQPIFAARCYECHAGARAESGFRLDQRLAGLAGGDRGPAIVPGKSGESPLVKFISGGDADLTMPPEEPRLTEKEVTVIRTWIDQGADWPEEASESRASEHWAFQAPQRPELPAVQQSAWIRNPIDAFVLSRLEKEGITPSPEADRVTLVRRLHLDLLGLPPTPDEVQAFLLDNRPDAYEQLVERLLASPHYGERWARHWLDLARYADSDGYEKDLPRPYAWRWRDWVIEAIQRDMPFDQFTIEQLAGDLLPDATVAQRQATGFHRNTLTNREGGADPQEDRAKAMVDRVSTTASVWLGLTMGCCECHSHKYDPITQREFYGMYAFFDAAREVDLRAPIAAEEAVYAEAKRKHDEEQQRLEAALAQYEQEELAAQLVSWEAKLTSKRTQWERLVVPSAVSAEGATLAVQEDGSVLASGTSAEQDTYTLTWKGNLSGVTALRLEAMPDDGLPGKGPGRSSQGNFVLSEITLTGQDDAQTTEVAFVGSGANFSQKGFGVERCIDRQADTGWAISPQMGREHLAWFELAKPIEMPGDAKWRLTLRQEHGKQHTLGRFRISVSRDPLPLAQPGLPNDVRIALDVPTQDRSEEQQAVVRTYAQQQDKKWNQLNDAVKKQAQQAPKAPKATTPTLARDENPRVTHVHIRGDFLRLGPEVKPHTPGVLPQLQAQAETADRLDLARWLVAPGHPLTARVAVNRIWMWHFGRGLVASVDDFGTRGDRPTHPELLDWLADEFVASGWSLKQLHRLMVSSATYRQSSAQREELAVRDPENQWLARQNRMRLEAELIRDVSLAASGLLNRQVGGPSVRPPIPAGVADLGYANSVKWPESSGPDRYRRGLYVFVQRTVPYPMLVAFDAPDGAVTCARRERSNTPLQALTLLNDQVFFECAQSLGAKLATMPAATPQERVATGFACTVGRMPSPVENARMLELLTQAEREFSQHAERAAQVAGTFVPENGDTAACACWTIVARALMNLEEFFTRE
jgi:hypothetical protein